MIDIMSPAAQQEKAADVGDEIEAYDLATWARDEKGGQLPGPSASAFGRWLYNAWEDFAEDETATVGQVLEGAVSDWCGGRSF